MTTFRPADHPPVDAVLLHVGEDPVRVVAVPVRMVVRVDQHGGMVPDRAGFVENDCGSRW